MMSIVQANDDNDVPAARNGGKGILAPLQDCALMGEFLDDNQTMVLCCLGVCG